MASTAESNHVPLPGGVIYAPPAKPESRRRRGRIGIFARTGIAIVCGAAAFVWHMRGADAPFGACVPGFGSGSAISWQNAGPSDEPRWVFQADTHGHPTGSFHVVDAGTSRYDAALTSSAFMVPQRGALVEFTQRRAYSWANTVGVLEIAVDDGPFADIASAGGKFLAGAYDGRSLPANPLGPRPAWAAASNSDTLTRVVLPASADGKPVRLRFRIGSAGTGDPLPGWYLGDIRCTQP